MKLGALVVLFGALAVGLRAALRLMPAKNDGDDRLVRAALREGRD